MKEMIGLIALHEPLLLMLSGLFLLAAGTLLRRQA
jgi:hypothetical protein